MQIKTKKREEKEKENMVVIDRQERKNDVSKVAFSF